MIGCYGLQHSRIGIQNYCVYTANGCQSFFSVSLNTMKSVHIHERDAVYTNAPMPLFLFTHLMIALCVGGVFSEMAGIFLRGQKEY